MGHMHLLGDEICLVSDPTASVSQAAWRAKEVTDRLTFLTQISTNNGELSVDDALLYYSSVAI